MTDTVTLESLQAELAAQVTAGASVDVVIAIADRMKKFRAEIAKAEALRLQKEADAMAEIRKANADKLHKMVVTRQAQQVIDLLATVKAIGFHYNYRVEGNVVDIGFDYQQAPKAPKATGAHNIGKSKDEYGLSLSEIVEKFATAEEKAEINAATSNSMGWQLKTKVKKAAIAAGKLQPIK